MNAVAMSDSDFNRLSDFIETELGIKMPEAKRPLLEARLQKRLRLMSFASFREYCDYVFSPAGEAAELIHMIDLVTTNKTDFFREPEHFRYLTGTALPDLAGSGAGFRRPLKAWSAGCSSGEEPYTIAMVMSEYGKRFMGRSFDYSILATDISTRVLSMASKGIYGEERIAPIPEELRRRYLLRSRVKSRALVRIVPELRGMVRFQRLNFMETDFSLRDQMDIIFCRNVVIYFDKPTQEALFNKFCSYMRPGSYLFIGHSETLNGFDLPLVKVGASAYRKIE